MKQEALESLFARYVDEGKWSMDDVPKKIKNNVDKKVKKIKKDKSEKGVKDNV